MLIPAVVLLGVVVGVVVGEWWAIGVALIAGAGAYAVDDVGAAVAFTLAAAAGVGMGVAVRRRGPRAEPPPG